MSHLTTNPIFYGPVTLSNGPLNLPASQGIYVPSGAPGVTTDKIYSVSGTLYFNGAAVGGSGGTPGGLDKQIQYNSAGTSFGGTAGFEFDSATSQATIPGLSVTQNFALSGIISPAQITADQNDYAPTGNAAASCWRINSDILRNITGISGGASGRIIILQNVGSYSIILKNENTSSTASNRFTFSTASDFTLSPNGNILLSYDNTSSRWKLLNQSGNTSWTIFDPDMPPSSPSALDDEYTVTGAINSSLWTTVNWGSASPTPDVNTTIPGNLFIKAANIGRTLICALQSIPVGDFTIIAKLDIDSISTAPECGVGLILSSTNTAASGSQLVLYNVNYAGVKRPQLYAWSNFNSLGAGSAYGEPRVRYFRIRRSGTTYYEGWSNDGITWNEVQTNPGTTPSYFGIVVNGNQAAAAVASIEYFRYSPSANATFGGYRIYNGFSSSTSAPSDAQFLVLAANGSLSNDRVLTFTTTQFLTTDSGAGNSFTIKYTGLDRITKTASYSATTAEFGSLIEVNSASATTQTLPTAVGATSRTISYKNIGAGLITMASTSSQTIDGITASSITIPTLGSVTFYSDGANWFTQNFASGGSGKPNYTRIAVADAIYTVLGNHNQIIAYTSLSTNRTVTLPAATTAGQLLIIQDESGSCSGTKQISLTAAGSDKIHDGTATTIKIFVPYGSITLCSQGTNKWMIVGRSPRAWYIKWLANDTFVCPPDLVAPALIGAQGGGGAGGTSHTTVRVGAGGGASGVFCKKLTALTNNSSYTITVGAGGTTVPNTAGSDGNSGGTSSFGSLVSSVGGRAGKGSGTVTTNYGGSGGTVSSPSASFNDLSWMVAATVSRLPEYAGGAGQNSTSFDNNYGSADLANGNGSGPADGSFTGGVSTTSSGVSRSGGGGAASCFGNGGNGAYYNGTSGIVGGTPTANTGAGGGGGGYNDTALARINPGPGASGFIEATFFF